MKASIKDGKIIDQEAKKMIKVLEKLSIAEAVFALTEYKKSLDKIQRQHTLLIESASKITSPQMNRIKKTLHTTYPILYTRFQLVPSLLGGLRITIGDIVFDDSIENRIKEVKEAIRL